MASNANYQGSTSLTRRHFYRMEFLADQHGVGKIMEFYASNLKEALAWAKNDGSRRVVDVREDGLFVCRVMHGPNGIALSRQAGRGRQD